MPRPFKLFHFDIATENNFGDTLLFPAVKHVFEAYGGGEAFDIYDSRPLRENVGPALVSYINETADAVLVGGGGLFLAGTNPNKESGWQWRISLEMLDKLEVPIIVFAVGYNRFYGQREFESPFSEHLARTIEKSIFFGLRNTGSIDRVSEYVPPSLADQIVYQPCPTTITRQLLPWTFEQPDTKRIGIQLSHENRQRAGGYSLERMIQAASGVIGALEDRDWEIIFTPFTKFDEKMSSRLGEKFDRHRVERIYGSGVLDRGLDSLSTVPVVLGCRGHAQMIPFGLGAFPFSFDVHPKLGYFHSDIGRPEWNADPRRDDFAGVMVETIEGAWSDRNAIRESLAMKQEAMLVTTQENLRTIYSTLGGDADALSRPWATYDIQGINLARSRFLLEIQRENSIHRGHTTAQQHRELEARLTRAERDNRTAREDRAVVEAETARWRLRATALEESIARLEDDNAQLRARAEQTPDRPPTRLREYANTARKMLARKSDPEERKR